MENRGTKAMAIAALIVGVVGLTIGFAAFTTTITIKPTATVNPDSSGWSITGTDFTCTGTAGNTAEGAVKPTGTASWTNTSVYEISGDIDVTLSYPGDSVTCTGTISNNGQYAAYLNSVAIEGLTADCSTSINAITNETSKTLATQACEGVTITALTVGGIDYKTGNAAIDDDSIGIGEGNTENVVITITYDENATRADESFTATFSDIILTYSSVD